ncbi:RNA dependent RNA polymerase [Plasmopara viticola lesion associated mononegaambi virus 8]|uniref:RNA-directed RNA polymerase n=1 Tax=Plasmopara viticola lesion associated mononegaambi virus 8 TaxID=2692020 RepID=A0A6B9Q463_9MONO|nr:RNA dependent RNA polymerase [Plasmopara viticola lesion associated mononegaambi virus 8]QHD64783.1 RNA dependent RNA polymerase [Plasmopara viticola lesion associated mononegaambi virus 8]
MDPNTYHPKPQRRDDDEPDDRQSKPPRRYFPDTYLDSPIMVTVRAKWIAKLMITTAHSKATTQFDRIVRDVLLKLPDAASYRIVDPDEYPSLYHTEWQSTITDEHIDSIACASKIYNHVSESVQSKSGYPLPTITKDFSSRALYWMHRWSYFDSLVEEFSKISAQSGPNACRISLSDHTSVVATKDMWFLSNEITGNVMLLYDQVLMLKDIMFSRFQTFVACSTLQPGNTELEDAIVELCDWHESCLIRYGNSGFEVLKQTEALSKAYLSAMSDKIFGEDGPYPRMVEKVREKEMKLGCTEDFLTDKFDTTLRKCSDIQTVVELFGLLKISGHPLIDARAGGLSAAHEARSDDQTLYEDAARLDWEFKRVMLESFIAKWGAWPTLKFTEDGKKTKLYSLYKAQRRGLNRSSYPLQDWEYCRYGKIVEFDYSPNYLELMDDKSISLYRSNIAATWKQDVKPQSHRRLLMELINRGTFDVKAIVSLIVRREVPFDWFIVSLHPKEREFKIAPRMFSMLVLEIRVFFALTEANLADKIFPYLPQQTMTKSKVAISRQFLEMTKPHTATHSLRMFLEIDLSRWNLRWRAMAVNPVARTLNDMFGVTGIFDFVHEFFAKSLILVRVQELEPAGIDQDRPPESDLLWYNHLGGFEGICQKLWTICTYSMVSIAVTPLPISYVLIGQGDNQILSITTSKDPSRSAYDTLSDLREEVTRRVAETCASVNQEVKPEECLESTSVITYSKDIYVNGVYRPTSLKFHSRLFPHSSQIFPSIRTNLGAIFATAVAGAEKSNIPMSSYYLACLHGAMYIYRISKGRGPYGKQIKHCRDLLKDRFHMFVEFMLTLPSEAGGFPVLPFLGFTYKGGSDPLSKSLAAMNMLGHDSSSRLANRMLSQMSRNEIYAAEPKSSTLLMDPYSIPLAKPPTAIDGVANETLEALTPAIRTREIKELMSADTTQYLDTLVLALSQCRPLNPVIMRDILDCSLAGITETVRKMFVATRTLQNVVRELGVPVIDKVLNLEAAGIAYMYNRFQMLPNDVAPRKSTYELSQQCRARWFPGQDNPIVGLTTYQPTDFTLHWGTKALDVEGINSVLVAESDPLETRGPFDPYVGSKTREKRSEHGYKIIGTDTASKAMRKLQLIASQTGDDSHFSKLIDAVGWSRTNTTLSDVSDLLPGTSGGTLAHRYAARTGHQDAFNIGSPNFATHLVISTDNMGPLSGGVYDYPFMVQEQVLYLNWMTQNVYMHSPNNFITGTLGTKCVTLEPLPSVSIRGPDELHLRVTRFPSNPLAFLPSLSLQRVSGAISHPALTTQSHYDPSPVLRRHVLEAYFKSLLRKSSTGRQIADGSHQHFASASMDIAEVYSNGLINITRAMSFVACDEAISNYMMTNLQHVARWQLQVYANRLVFELCKAVSPLVGHPMLAKDPLIRKLGLHDTPSYGGADRTIHGKLSAYVTGQVTEMLMCVDTEFNHRSYGLFSSDNSRSLSETVLTALLHDLYIWRAQNRLPSDMLREVMGKKLIPAVRAHHEEQDKVDTMMRAVMKLSQMSKLSEPIISKTLRSYHTTRFVGYKTAVEEVLKATRQVDQWGMPPEVSYSTARKLKLPHTLPKSRYIKVNGCLNTRVGYTFIEDRGTDKETLLMNMYVRNKGRCGLMSGSAVHAWSAFAPLFRKNPVIVIGSGMGAVARVALDAGCPYVYGLDLRTTIPLRSHRFRFYKPPMVMSSRYSEQYHQMAESFTTSGDWFDESVCRAALDYDSGESTLVIDIQKGKHRYGLEVLTNTCLSTKKRGLIMARFYLSEHEIKQMASDLHYSGFTYHMYDIWSSSDISQVVVLITSWNRTPMVAVVPEVETESAPHLPDAKVDVSPEEMSMALSDAVLNVTYSDSATHPGDIEIAIDRLLDSAWGDHDSRFSYGEWTRWLRAKVVISWILSSKQRGRDLLLMFNARSYKVTTAQGHSVQVDVGWDLCYHLATVASRVCFD